MIRQLDKWTTTALVALLSSVGTARAYEHAEIGACTTEPRVRIYSTFAPMRPRCGQLDYGTAHRLWADAALESWIYAGSYSAPWAILDGACTSTSAYPLNGGGNNDTTNVAQRSTTPPYAYLQAQYACDGANRATFSYYDIHVTSYYADLPPDCSSALVTENGSWIHEAGHLYGWWHFDDYLSTMNTFAPDTTSCRSDRLARPSSDAQQGQDAWYGWPAAKDVGISPLVQTGVLNGMGGGWHRPSATYAVSNGSTSLSYPIKFTFMNMRDSWGTSQRVAFYLSNDKLLNAGDTRLNTVTLPTGSQAQGAISAYTYNAQISPQTHLPVNVLRCIIVVADPDNQVTETEEYDNATDTKYCFYRMAP